MFALVRLDANRSRIGKPQNEEMNKTRLYLARDGERDGKNGDELWLYREPPTYEGACFGESGDGSWTSFPLDPSLFPELPNGEMMEVVLMPVGEAERLKAENGRLKDTLAYVFKCGRDSMGNIIINYAEQSYLESVQEVYGQD